MLSPLSLLPSPFIILLMFYNCENLLLSQGHTYEKLTNLTRVIVAAGEGTPPSIIGLAEVENDSIMRRWTTRTPLARWHYQYIITHSDDQRGINVAMMYQPEDFNLLGHESLKIIMPKDIKPTRDLLHAWGKIINGDTLDVIVCHLPSRYGGKKASEKARHIAHERLRTIMDSVTTIRSNPHLVVMGDMNDYPTSKSMLSDFEEYENLMLPLHKSLKKDINTFGSHKHNGEWGFLDQFIVNKSMAVKDNMPKDSLLNINNVCAHNARSFALPFMLTTDEKNLSVRPKRSRYGYKYEGGYSDHLPILLDLLIEIKSKSN